MKISRVLLTLLPALTLLACKEKEKPTSSETPATTATTTAPAGETPATIARELGEVMREMMIYTGTVSTIEEAQALPEKLAATTAKVNALAERIEKLPEPSAEERVATAIAIRKQYAENKAQVPPKPEIKEEDRAEIERLMKEAHTEYAADTAAAQATFGRYFGRKKATPAPNSAPNPQ